MSSTNSPWQQDVKNICQTDTELESVFETIELIALVDDVEQFLLLEPASFGYLELARRYNTRVSKECKLCILKKCIDFEPAFAAQYEIFVDLLNDVQNDAQMEQDVFEKLNTLMQHENVDNKTLGAAIYYFELLAQHDFNAGNGSKLERHFCIFTWRIVMEKNLDMIRELCGAMQYMLCQVDGTPQYDTFMQHVLPLASLDVYIFASLFPGVADDIDWGNYWQTVARMAFDFVIHSKTALLAISDMLSSMNSLQHAEFFDKMITDAIDNNVSTVEQLNGLCNIIHNCDLCHNPATYLLNKYNAKALPMEHMSCTPALASMISAHHVTHFKDDELKIFTQHLVNYLMAHDTTDDNVQQALQCVPYLTKYLPSSSFSRIANTLVTFLMTYKSPERKLGASLSRLCEETRAAKQCVSAVYSILLQNGDWKRNRPNCEYLFSAISILFEHASQLEREQVFKFYDKYCKEECTNIDILLSSKNLLKYGSSEFRAWFVNNYMPKILARSDISPRNWQPRLDFVRLLFIYANEWMEQRISEVEQWISNCILDISAKWRLQTLLVYRKHAITLEECKQLYPQHAKEVAIHYYGACSCRFPLEFGPKLIQAISDAQAKHTKIATQFVVIEHGMLSYVKMNPLIVIQNPTITWLKHMCRARTLERHESANREFYHAVCNIREKLTKSQWQALMQASKPKYQALILRVIRQYGIFDQIFPSYGDVVLCFR